jgi:hypothetical protein
MKKDEVCELVTTSIPRLHTNFPSPDLPLDQFSAFTAGDTARLSTKE